MGRRRPFPPPGVRSHCGPINRWPGRARDLPAVFVEFNLATGTDFQSRRDFGRRLPLAIEIATVNIKTLGLNRNLEVTAFARFRIRLKERTVPFRTAIATSHTLWHSPYPIGRAAPKNTDSQKLKWHGQPQKKRNFRTGIFPILRFPKGCRSMGFRS